MTKKRRDWLQVGLIAALVLFSGVMGFLSLSYLYNSSVATMTQSLSASASVTSSNLTSQTISQSSWSPDVTAMCNAWEAQFSSHLEPGMPAACEGPEDQLLALLLFWGPVNLSLLFWVGLGFLASASGFGIGILKKKL